MVEAEEPQQQVPEVGMAEQQEAQQQQQQPMEGAAGMGAGASGSSGAAGVSVQDASSLAQDDEELDKEAKDLLAELARSQDEVKRMLGLQRAQATELGGLKSKLATELQDLQDESWKLEVFGELESLKQQLAALDGLDAPEDAFGAQPEGAAKEGGGGSQKEGGGGEGGEGEEEYNAEEMAEMQTKLDADLADMFAQLQTVKLEATEVNKRKIELEKELQELLAAQDADHADHLASLDQDKHTSLMAAAGAEQHKDV